MSELSVGLEPGAVLGHGRPHLPGKPIVVYGSSIVQGLAASRPGNTYPNMLCRRLDRNVINLGFDGGCRAELPVIHYLAGLDMSLFVYDYDHNAIDADFLRRTHKHGFDIIRTAQPDLPILLISSPNVATNPKPGYRIERKEIIRDTYRAAKAAGDRNIWFIDGESFFRGPYEFDCFVDGLHPNDLGLTLMADNISAVIRRALREKAE